MIVEKELFDHPKFLRLKKRIGDSAAEHLLRLWGHCQETKRGERWPNVDSEYVEMVARWNGNPGDLFSAMKDCRWLEVIDGDVVIHEWNEHNPKLVGNWLNGPKGGRPKGGKPKRELGKPNGNPKLDSVNPNETQIEIGVTDQIRSDQIRSLITREPRVGDKKGASPQESEGKGARPRAADVAASKARWAALTKGITELEKAGPENLTDDERNELFKKRAELRALEARQQEGKF
nr:hypothetical protein [uncultured Rhodopila sp.]